MSDAPNEPLKGSPQVVILAGMSVENVRTRLDRVARKEIAKAKCLAGRAKLKEEKQEAKSLAILAERKILKDLISSLETHARSATFACGGSVSFKSAVVEAVGELPEDSIEQKLNTTDFPRTDTAAVDDVQVRFGLSGSGVKVNFDKNGPSPNDCEYLLKACQPARFGSAGEAILDGKYRKAGKLDCSQFATTFCPYEAGIVGVVTQLLVPQYEHGKHRRSTKAELYKLNVYSAPNGKFKPHVNTARSEGQIGSLVVLLPSAHEGGQLTVNNAGASGQNGVFDWSTTNYAAPAKIKWAAFYSYCEYEVHEVTSDHRVTLTYNLYLTRGAGHLDGVSPALDSTRLPLYEGLQTALENPAFLRDGRVLAVYLNHSHVVLEHGTSTGLGVQSRSHHAGSSCIREKNPYRTESDDEDDDDRPYHLFQTKFQPFAQSDMVTERDGKDTWGHKLPEEKVTWLNSNGDFREVQTAHPTYGNVRNEPGMGIDCTRAAMLIRIPPYHERGSGKTQLEFFWEGMESDATDDDEYVNEENPFSYSSGDEMDYEYDEGRAEDEDDEDDEGNEARPSHENDIAA